MAIMNLLDLQPTTISRDLRNKYLLIYGQPKTGKTSFAAECPKNLIFCFEKGVNFLPGVYAVDVPKWPAFKALLKQLAKPEVREKFDTVTIDTLSIAWGLCEQYICSQKGVETIGAIPWGQGYALLKDEFADALRQISMLGYGMILITHAKTRIEKIDEDNSRLIVSPNIPDRAQDIVNALVDIIGYIKVEQLPNGESRRTLITRETPTVVAGSRLKYLEAEIPFGYTELTEAIGRAIEKQGTNDGAMITDKTQVQEVIQTRPFEETVAEARELWNSLVNKDAENAAKIMEKVKLIFGYEMKLSEIPADKQDLFELLIEDMKELC
jgi:hypothetical protein